jgi:hypothetical protein
MFVLLVLFTLFAVGLAMALSSKRPAPPDELLHDLGVWKTDVESASARSARACGLRRQERVCLRPARGLFRGGELVREVRYLSELTLAVVRTEQDEIVKLPRAVR